MEITRVDTQGGNDISMPFAAGYRAPSVGRALKILELVSESKDGLSISELSRRLEISKGTVFGLCQQLETGGALLRDPATKLYGLGPLVGTLAQRSYVLTRLRDAAGPELSHLSLDLGQSFFLGVMGRDHVTVVDCRQPAGHIGISAGPGTRLPLTAGAVGRVFLAALPPAQADRIISRGIPPHTPNTVTDPENFRALLEQVRQDGYSVERDQYLMGVWGAAAGLGSVWGTPAALWSVGFNTSLPDPELERIGLALRDSARRILSQN